MNQEEALKMLRNLVAREYWIPFCVFPLGVLFYFVNDINNSLGTFIGIFVVALGVIAFLSYLHEIKLEKVRAIAVGLRQMTPENVENTFKEIGDEYGNNVLSRIALAFNACNAFIGAALAENIIQKKMLNDSAEFIAGWEESAKIYAIVFFAMIFGVTVADSLIKLAKGSKILAKVKAEVLLEIQKLHATEN